MEKLAYPPRITAFTKTFWDGLAKQQFLTTKCNHCGELTFPPKPLCPGCWSKDLSWIELKGTGVLRSYTEVTAAPLMFAAEAPYVIALIDLDEGIRCMSRVLAPYDTLRPDMRVRVKVRVAEPSCLFDFVIDP
jgi:uncharacterized protein